MKPPIHPPLSLHVSAGILTLVYAFLLAVSIWSVLDPNAHSPCGIICFAPFCLILIVIEIQSVIARSKTATWWAFGLLKLFAATSLFLLLILVLNAFTKEGHVLKLKNLITLLTFLAITLFLFLAAAHHEDWYQRLAHFRSTHLCPTCHYDLRATPHRCPECGHTPLPSGSPRGAGEARSGGPEERGGA